MKTEISEAPVKGLDYYMTLPYTIILRQDEEGDMIAEMKELEGCTAHGKDANEALEMLREFQKAWIERRMESGQYIPEPEKDDDLPSGKWVQRVPRTLHRQLADMAKVEGVSLNQLVTSMLSQQLGSQSLQAAIKRTLESMNVHYTSVGHYNRAMHFWDAEETGGEWAVTTLRPDLRLLPYLERISPKIPPMVTITDLTTTHAETYKGYTTKKIDLVSG